MPKYTVTFEPAGRTVEVDADLYPCGGEGRPGSLLDIALAHGVEIECTCGGHGACGTCHVVVEAGAENLSEADDEELDRIDEVPGSTLRSRLACLAVVAGDVTVTVPDRGRNIVSEHG